MLGFDVLNENPARNFVARKTGVVPANAGALTILFTITGTVLLRVIAVCTESPTTSDAVSLAVKGYSGTSAGASLLTDLADALELDIGEIWTDDTLAKLKAVAATDPIVRGFLFGNGLTIKLVPTGTWTAGIIDFFCVWTPLSADGNVVAN